VRKSSTAAKRERDEEDGPIARRVVGGKKLRAWLKKEGKTQLWLSGETGVGQQLISAYAHQISRPQPMSANALRIQTATAGHVTVWDWMTAEEKAEYRVADQFGLSEKV